MLGVKTPAIVPKVPPFFLSFIFFSSITLLINIYALLKIGFKHILGDHPVRIEK